MQSSSSAWRDAAGALDSGGGAPSAAESFLAAAHTKAGADATAQLLTFLRSLGAAFLYPTLLHLGVRQLSDVRALADDALEREGVTQLSTFTLRQAAEAWGPPLPPVYEWDELVTAEGYVYFVNVRAAALIDFIGASLLRRDDVR